MTSKTEKIKILEIKLAAMKAQAARDQMAAKARASKAARALATRRKILLGAFVLDRLDGDPGQLKIKGLSLLDWLTRAEDRALFLTPPNGSATGVADPGTPPPVAPAQAGVQG